MLRSLLPIVVLWATTALADKNLDIPFPFNCSTRTLCSSLRIKLPAEHEQFNAKFVNSINGSLFFNLTNEKGDELSLFISYVENSRFRVIVEEHDHHRYMLEHSLEKEPSVSEITVLSSNANAVEAVDATGLNKLIVRTTPLSIEFYHNDVLETILEGNRIIMENTNESQAFTFSVLFNGAKRLMGLHEHADTFNLRHTVDLSIDPYRLRNTDYGTTKYDLNTTESMYGSIPVLYGFGNTTSGIFVHNAAEMYIDIDNHRKSAYFMVDGGIMDIFVLLGPTLRDTVRQYVDLTGKPHLPQLWALGYHQCRWAYNSTDDVMDTISSFDEFNFPLDVLWLDIEYTADRKWFSWNRTTFPDPIELLNWVDSQGHRKLVPISDPHIKLDPEYKVYTDCLENNYFVTNPNGTPFVSECWPGDTSWIDFVNPKAREYYGNLHLYENFPSTPALGGFWNDMNEPTLFDNLYERTLPFSTLHYGNVKHRDVHNIYGMLQTMSTHHGLMARDNGRLRPFILSRAYFAGSQRYANKWSGDNWGHFEDMRISVPMTLTSNLVGIAFYGADIPGFFGTATEELVNRWYQIGIWLPFFRAHAANGSPRREPYRFSNETQVILREVMQFRYKHIPYWYSLFYEHTRYGDPIVRPLLYEYPEDEKVYDIFDELLIGKDILAASVYMSNASDIDIYFPGQNEYWYQVTGNDSKVYIGTSRQNINVDITFSPVFYRGGSIITRWPNVLRSTADTKNDPFELFVMTDQNGNATGNVYIDDFESFDYLENKHYLYLFMSYDQQNNKIDLRKIDEDSNSTNISFGVSAIHIYSKFDNGSYTVKTYDHANDGTPLVDIKFTEQSILLN